MNLDNWKANQTWWRRGENFAVEISRHTVPSIMSSFRDSGPHRWCVYAYVHQQHPHFAEFRSDLPMRQPATMAMPLHYGASYLCPTYAADGAILTWKAGADYNHLHDEFFTECEEMPNQVLADAERLFAWLEECGKVERAAEEAQP